MNEEKCVVVTVEEGKVEVGENVVAIVVSRTRQRNSRYSRKKQKEEKQNQEKNDGSNREKRELE